MMPVIAGTNIGPDPLQPAPLDADGRFARTIADTQVLVNGRPSPLIYVSKGQTGFIVPYDIAIGSPAQVVLVYKGVRSAPLSVPIVAANPGLFSAHPSGTGPGAILNQDNSLNRAQNP